MTHGDLRCFLLVGAGSAISLVLVILIPFQGDWMKRNGLPDKRTLDNTAGVHLHSCMRPAPALPITANGM